jgi:drug/metabolite transporter (DMT)-like permease
VTRKTTADDDLPRAAAFMVAAALLFAGMGLTVKLASGFLANNAVVFLRNTFGLLALLPWLGVLRRQGLGTRNLREHLIRSLAGLASMYCYFFALGRLPLAVAVLLNYSLPLLLPLVERVWLGQPLPGGLWPPLAVGFVGIALVLQPGPGLVQPAALVGLAAALLASVAQVGVRRLTATDPPERIVFYFAVISTAVSSLPAAATWQMPPRGLWGLLVVMGVLATAGQLTMTRAYSLAPAGRVGPFIYSSVVFAGALDWLVRGTLPDALSLCGAALVMVAGILALTRQRRPLEPAAVE